MKHEKGRDDECFLAPLSLFVSLYAISQYTLLVYTTSVSSYILLGHAMLICPWSSGYDRVPHWPI